MYFSYKSLFSEVRDIFIILEQSYFFSISEKVTTFVDIAKKPIYFKVNTKSIGTHSGQDPIYTTNYEVTKLLRNLTNIKYTQNRNKPKNSTV